jgi:ABC-type protease/lipase transport system fused ATPase/permease subunit
MAEGRSDRKSRLKRWVEWLGAFLVLPTLAVLFAGGVYAIADAVLAPTPPAQRPGFIDTVLASRAVVAAIRLAIIFAAVFIVVSVVALIGRGQWLIRVGPVQVSEQVSDIDAENQRLRASLDNAQEIIDDLRQDLIKTGRVVNQTTQDPGEPG